MFTTAVSGGTKSISTTSRASSIVSTLAHDLEQKLEPLIKVSTDVNSEETSKEPLIKVSTEITTKAASIRPSKVTAAEISSKEAISEENDKLTDIKSTEEEEDKNGEDFEEQVEDELSTEFRTEKSVTMSSSSGIQPFTSDENKIDTTNEVNEKGSFVKQATTFEKPKEGRPSAALSYKERLKARLAKEKAKLAKLKNFSKESTSERRMFSLEEEEDQSYKARIPRERRFRSRFDQVPILG